MTEKETGFNEGETVDNPEITEGARNEQAEVNSEQPASNEEITAAMDTAETTASDEIALAQDTADHVSADANADQQTEIDEASGGFKEKMGEAGRMLIFKILTGNATPKEFERWAGKAQNDGSGYLHNEFKPLLDEHGYNGDDHFTEKDGETVIKKLPPRQILSAYRGYKSQQAEQRRDVRAANKHNERSDRLRDKFRM